MYYSHHLTKNLAAIPRDRQSLFTFLFKKVLILFKVVFVNFLSGNSNKSTFPLHLRHSGSGLQMLLVFTQMVQKLHQANAVWSAGCLQPVQQSDQTMRLLLSLLFLLVLGSNQPALSDEKQDAKLISTRVERIWQNYAQFNPRCDQFRQRDVCVGAEKFLKGISVHASSLRVKLLFGQPHGLGVMAMMDKTCALYTFHQGRPVGISTFYRGGKLIRMQEGEVQWTRRRLGPVVWLEQHTGKTRLLLARVEGIEEEEVAVARKETRAAPLYSRATLTEATQDVLNKSELQSLPSVRFVVEKGAEEIPVGKSLVSNFPALS